MWDRRARFVSNHDGDTVTMILDQGFKDEKEIDVRLFGVFAPELSQPGGKECKGFVENWFLSNEIDGQDWNFIVTTIRMKRADAEQMTFDRYVAVITTIDGSDNLNIAIQSFINENGYSGGVGG